MRSTHFLALMLPVISLFAIACESTPQPQQIQLDTVEKKASYSIGMNFVSRLNKEGANLDIDALIYGMRDAEAGKTPALSDEEMAQAIKDLQAQLQSDKLAELQAMAESNLGEGKAFLEANAAKEGVITTDSGLQYKVLEEGSGASPTADDTVVTHYEGRLINGQVFDSSYERGEPATFPVSGVIPGWTEALQLMKEGAKWRLFVPADLAYGEAQRGPLIEPNSTLIFDIELLDINPEEE
ncbi:MAG: FKBP-type peptidyl-prolyl cis-trans isomerase [Gammaproteobacteria bacterium]|nr:FKBP-type peptidyl-prolyl cis-trans isomerase [Gammaproteobacteria bacterium]